jgi:hypothetical protein
VEEKFRTGDVRQAWDGLKTMMGKTGQKSNKHLPHTLESVNELNKFYARFDVRDFSADCDSLCQTIKPEPLNIAEDHVVSVFKRLNPNKAPGPDGVKGKILKNCASQLGKIFTLIFQLLLDSHIMPRAWRTSTIIPVPKSASASEPKDFRPVALTSVVAKCFETVLRSHLITQVGEKLDPFQFAYRARRGTDDACLSLLDLVAKHLQKPKTYVRILMIDFSSAFNCMEPLVLLRRLVNLRVNSNLILFVNSFLRDRPQRVRSSGLLSDELIVSTGAPQGCVLSPTLFSIYTDEIRFNDTFAALFKFADDMALVGFLTGEASLATYYANVQKLANWCSESFLELNVRKTRELVFDDRKGDNEFIPVQIGGEPVEVVSCFKYLGTIIDSRLTFGDNVDHIYKKSQQRMYLMRKLKSFGVSPELLQTVYKSLIESLLMYNISCWFGHLSVQNRAKLDRIVRLAGRIIGIQQVSVSALYRKTVLRKAKRILADPTHPLFPEFRLLPSGRRFDQPLARKNCYKRSFIPIAVSVLNGKL